MVLPPGGRMYLGRQSTCEMCLHDARVSGNHMYLSLTEDGAHLTVTDTSTNGTFLNGYQLLRGVQVEVFSQDIISPVVILRRPPWTLSDEKQRRLGVCARPPMPPGGLTRAATPPRLNLAPFSRDPCHLSRSGCRGHPRRFAAALYSHAARFHG